MDLSVRQLSSFMLSPGFFCSQKPDYQGMTSLKSSMMPSARWAWRAFRVARSPIVAPYFLLGETSPMSVSIYPRSNSRISSTDIPMMDSPKMEALAFVMIDMFPVNQ